MKGIILFVDNHVFQAETFENNLFNCLNEDGQHPVLPINSLDAFEKTTNSISTFKAIVLDWNFLEENEDTDGAEMPSETPESILVGKNIYSLIFIYSRNEIPASSKMILKKQFGDKIEFLLKIRDESAVSEKERLLARIAGFDEENPHLQTPYIWSHAINSSVQSIFSELEQADKFWIKDLYFSSFAPNGKGGFTEPPPVDANIQVINLFQNLLSEKLIQDSALRLSIETYSRDNISAKSDENALMRLYQRLYYTSTLESDSIMTGDVYEIEESKFGIIISPECDMNTLIVKNWNIELLCFKQGGFKDAANLLQLKREEIAEKLPRAYNQENPRYHFLPVFPISTSERETAFIDFRFSHQVISAEYLKKNPKNRRSKINSPYIQQLRQRYLAYLGRVGVPNIPDSLRAIS